MGVDWTYLVYSVSTTAGQLLAEWWPIIAFALAFPATAGLLRLVGVAADEMGARRQPAGRVRADDEDEV
jgi:hypothetical protein